MIRVILWDIDGTLLDFLAAEKNAIRTCFSIHGLGECSDEMIARYSVINRGYWERLERGEISKQEVLVGRFREFFQSEGFRSEIAEAFNDDYQIRLSDTVVFCDHSYELVKSLRGKVKQYAVTNGTLVAQERKLASSGLDKLLDGVFISDQIGYEKPSPGFFDAVWREIGSYHRDEVLIVGDSLTSDIKGGNQAGILCAWYNPMKKPLPECEGERESVRIDYDIQNLWEIVKLVES